METEDLHRGTEDHLHKKCQVQDYQNKDRLYSEN